MEAEPINPKSSAKKTFLIFLGIISLVLLITICIYYIGNKISSTKESARIVQKEAPETKQKAKDETKKEDKETDSKWQEPEGFQPPANPNANYLRSDAVEPEVQELESQLIDMLEQTDYDARLEYIVLGDEVTIQGLKESPYLQLLRESHVEIVGRGRFEDTTGQYDYDEILKETYTKSYDCRINVIWKGEKAFLKFSFWKRRDSGKWILGVGRPSA